jgi:hypothetical protein
MKQSKGTTPTFGQMIILSILLVLSVNAVCLAVPDGDVDGNCKVTAADALLILRVVMGLDVITPGIQLHGDVAPLGLDGKPQPDGILSIADALIVLQKSVDLVTWVTTPPIITSQPLTSGLTDTTYRYQVTSTGTEGTQARYVLDKAPAGMTIDSTSGLITWMPSTSQIGSHPVIVRLGELSCTTARQSFVVQITLNSASNRTPLANAGTNQIITLAAGLTTTTVNLNGSASSDLDGTIMSYTWSGTPKPANTVSPIVTLGVGNYTFTLVVTDNKGAASAPVMVTVIVNPDTTPLVITIAAPKSGSTTKSATVSVEGSANKALSAITVNNRLATINGTSFTLTDISLQEGANTLVVAGTDVSGNKGSAAVTITRDSISPTAPVLDQPTGPTRTATVTLTGQTEGGAMVRLFRSGQFIREVKATKAGLFTLANTALIEGANFFTVRAVDPSGNEGPLSVSRTVILDTMPPGITVTSPVNGLVTKAARVQVSGTVDDAEATLTIGVLPVTISNKSFSVSYPLQEGANTIMAKAVDKAGNEGSASVQVTLDLQAPIATLAAPATAAAGSDVIISLVVRSIKIFTI